MTVGPSHETDGPACVCILASVALPNPNPIRSTGNPGHIYAASFVTRSGSKMKQALEHNNKREYPTAALTPTSAPEVEQSSKSKAKIASDTLTVVSANDTVDFTPSRITVLAGSAAPTVQRLNRDTGYGDFCFGRFLLRHRFKRFKRFAFVEDRECLEKWSEEVLSRGSYCQPVEELEDFLRDGPFKYFKLPLEIRLRIIRLLVQPFFENEDYPDRHDLRLFISQKYIRERASNFNGGFEGYVQRRIEESKLWYARDDGRLHARLTAIHKTMEQSKMRYDILEKSFFQESMVHPHRSYDHDITAQMSRPWSKASGPRDDWPMLKFMRNLSNVSVQFRHELAHVVFAKVALIIDFKSFISEGLSRFIADRPRIQPNIRSLTLQVDFWGRPVGPKTLSKFKNSIQKLRDIEGFHIPVLRLSIRLWDINVKRLFSKDKFLNDFAPVRRLPVTESFEPILELGPWTVVEDKAARIKRFDELNRKYLPALQAALRPDSLREPLEQTKEAKYLRERELMLSKPASA
ncbi:hypothetical protein BKA64DRAFT_642214 [Cadophora sp. MPI-SDFR-AT-0126]|nr:hypothetical protein BKA64DRAFT_642214 [Leotiomycetes sp. MPI-SDFR-AT-0126]